MPSTKRSCPEMSQSRLAVITNSLRNIANGYNRLSAIAFAVLITAGLAAGHSYDDLLDGYGKIDLPLAILWLWIGITLPWKVRVKRDITLLFVALLGGAVIEWWGTTTDLWWYYTRERPPLWIIPAWCTAALASDRTALLLTALFEQSSSPAADCPSQAPHLSQSESQMAALPPASSRWRVAYFTIVPGFVLGMLHFLWPSLKHTASWVVSAIMLGVTFFKPKPKRDTIAFIGASLVGWLIEYWGTTRHCWTYYTRSTPPFIAVLAHGFATLAFLRAVDLVLEILPAFAATKFRNTAPSSELNPQNNANPGA